MNRYKVKCDRKYLDLISKKKIKNLELSGDLLSFECMKIKDFSEIEFVEILDMYKIKTNNVIKNYMVTLIGFLLLLLILIPITKTVTEIKFVDVDTYDEKVYTYVESRLKKVWMFAFLDDDIVEINKDIRSEFYDYQWISLEKEGTKVLINISDDDSLINDEVNMENKSLYSGYDSIVEGYFVESGTISIKVGHSVSKGDLLIDGHVKMYNGALKEVEAKGYVYGKVVENKVITINKKEEKIERTGKVETHKIYVVFDTSLNDPIPSFENYEAEYETLYSLGESFLIKEVTYYEISSFITIYSKDDVISLGELMLYNEFKVNKKYDFEEIIEIKILSIVENENDYVITYQMESLKDLCS